MIIRQIIIIIIIMIIMMIMMITIINIRKENLIIRFNVIINIIITRRAGARAPALRARASGQAYVASAKAICYI